MRLERERYAPSKGVFPMKKTVFVLVWALASVLIGTPCAFAVMPPSNFEETTSTSSLQRVQGAIETLEQDQRRMEDILRDIKRDEDMLNQILAGELQRSVK